MPLSSDLNAEGRQRQPSLDSAYTRLGERWDCLGAAFMPSVEDATGDENLLAQIPLSIVR